MKNSYTLDDFEYPVPTFLFAGGEPALAHVGTAYQHQSPVTVTPVGSAAPYLRQPHRRGHGTARIGQYLYSIFSVPKSRSLVQWIVVPVGPAATPRPSQAPANNGAGGGMGAGGGGGSSNSSGAGDPPRYGAAGSLGDTWGTTELPPPANEYEEPAPIYQQTSTSHAGGALAPPGLFRGIARVLDASYVGARALYGTSISAYNAFQSLPSPIKRAVVAGSLSLANWAYLQTHYSAATAKRIFEWAQSLIDSGFARAKTTARNVKNSFKRKAPQARIGSGSAASPRSYTWLTRGIGSLVGKSRYKKKKPAKSYKRKRY